MIAKVVKKYKLGDPQQDIDDQEFWDQQTIKYKIEILQQLREQFYPILIEKSHDKQRFLRVHKTAGKTQG